MNKTVCALGFLVAATMLMGCGSKPVPVAKRAKVSGTVIVDGKSLQTGNIVFDANNGEPPGSFNVLDGKFEGMAAVGKNKVSISAYRKISMKEKMKMDGPGYDELVDENILPARYSTESKLEKEVTEAGPNEFNFDLKGK